GPAGRAGVRTNDVIVALDDAPVQGLTLNQAVEKMRGPLNTPIRLRIQRSGEDRPIELTIYREVITLRPVSYRVEDDVGYIRVRQFNERTTDGVKDALGFLAARIPADRLKGYVLDLRNNSGGLLDQAISVSDVFLESGEILSTRGRAADETQRFSARPGDLAYGKPLVVLVNHGSAAATEAVAAALQYHRRAIVVGSRSFGRGSIQTMIPLGEGRGMLRLTTAHMFTPGGNPIEGVGITPDVEVLQKAPLGSDAEVTSQVASCGGDQYEEQAATAYVPTDPDDDKALQTAFGLLRGGARPATEQHR
ncbi:MAG TPA: S41 family peptidase, partial [Xanthobacteraceae bacterium]|nr:S41 family peptidase [Xanthobacteraceae bacterium]